MSYTVALEIQLSEEGEESSIEMQVISHIGKFGTTCTGHSRTMHVCDESLAEYVM